MAENRSPRGGRRPSPKGEGKRAPVSFRTRQDLRDDLDKAAGESGRSLAQEIEHRLERSFADEEQKQKQEVERWGGTHNSALIKCMGHLIKSIEAMCGGTWATDAYTHEQVRKGMNAFLDALRPSGSAHPEPGSFAEQMAQRSSEDRRQELLSSFGPSVAQSLLYQIEITSETDPQLENMEGKRVFVSNEIRLAGEVAPILGPLLLKSRND